MDEPLADPSAIALYFVSQTASKHVKVALSGEGADEFLVVIIFIENLTTYFLLLAFQNLLENYWEVLQKQFLLKIKGKKLYH